MKPVFTRQLYLSGQGNVDLMGEAEKIMVREQWSFNKFIEESVKEFVRRHKEGNVSFQLDKFGVSWTKAVSIDKKEEEKKSLVARRKIDWKTLPTEELQRRLKLYKDSGDVRLFGVMMELRERGAKTE